MADIKRFGERAVLVNLEQRIDQDINERVIRLAEDLRQALPTAIQYTIPAYCSLTIRYDPQQNSFSQISAIIEDLLEQDKGESRPAHRQLIIPVCYDPPFGLDIEALCREKGMRMEELISQHTETCYRVFMLGFLPGFVYMGRLADALQCKRKNTPRLRVPARSVAIAGFQTGIYPSEAPGGWHIIGRTPLLPMQPQEKDPFLFRAGDQVQFQSVSLTAYREIEEQIKEGSYTLKISYG